MRRRLGSSVIWVAAFLGGLAVIALILYAVRVGQGQPDTPTTLPIPGPDQPAIPNGPVEAPSSAKPRRRVAWVTDDNVPARTQPGLNMPEVKKFTKWEEVYWIEDSSNWDHVALEDGQEVWLESRFLTFARPANLNAPSKAEKLVMGFYAGVARKDYTGAYEFLSPEWRKELSFAQFVDGYSHTLSLRSEIVNVVELGEDRFQVDVSMMADEDGKDVPYLGIYTVERVGERWMLTSGRLKRQAGPPERTF
ncbi:MAG: SH3 domain-containing protein [Candidatus Eremiobacteraeota bacterium]|nr:SH3 domain-containing protein [Candidatus Eremiobacteraeota bacterium]